MTVCSNTCVTIRMANLQSSDGTPVKGRGANRLTLCGGPLGTGPPTYAEWWLASRGTKNLKSACF